MEEADVDVTEEIGRSSPPTTSSAEGEQGDITSSLLPASNPTPVPSKAMDLSGGGGSGFEEGGLMDLYESRLKRLRDYESRVHSRYSSQSGRRSAVTPIIYSQKNTSTQQKPAEASASVTDSSFAATGSLPREIDMGEGESLGELTLSTGYNSNLGLVEMSKSKEDHMALSAQAEADQRIISLGGSGDVDDEKVSVSEIGELSVVSEIVEGLNVDDAKDRGDNDSDESIEKNEDEDHVALPITTDDASHSEEDGSHSSQRPDELSGIKETEEEEASTLSNGEDRQDAYTYDGALDSKYQSYAVMVDPEEDDRAVEIMLSSNARPHMRAFHAAWLGFFIAFFAWFSITPLLSEVARSLHLNRKEIWTSSTLAVASSAITRVMAGPANDIYGPRMTMSSTLFVSAIPCTIAGLAIQNATSLYIIRFLIGCGGSAFVTCQFWAVSSFNLCLVLPVWYRTI